MGSEIGKGVYLGSDRMRVFDLISVGDFSSISKEACLLGYEVGNGMLRIGRMRHWEKLFHRGPFLFAGQCKNE